MSLIIPQEESSIVEFKTSFNDEAIISLGAFANSKGGVVYIGVADNGVVKGIEIGKETLQKWLNEIKNKTSPSLIPDVEVIDEHGRKIVLLKTQEYPIKPLFVKGKCYKRKGNSNHLMSVEDIANEHLKTINTSWDFYIDPNHSVKQISLDKVSRFIKRIELRTERNIPYTPIEFLAKTEMIRDGKPTFGAYLLFVEDYCLISDVQIGRFKSDITIIDSLSLNMDLFSEVDEIIAFIKKHLMVEYIITGEPQRIERFDYPLDAIREVVINMVVHRDYRDSSGSIIKIYDNRIEFYNPGKLYGGTTIQDLLSGNYTSRSRNKLIAKAFKEVGLIERYGSGIYRIQKLCRDYGIVEPVFEEVSNGFQVIIYKEKRNEPVYEPVNVPVNVPVNDRQKEIISLIHQNNSVSINELSKICKVGRETIKRDLNKLKQMKLILRIGPDKGGHWQIVNSN